MSEPYAMVDCDTLAIQGMPFRFDRPSRLVVTLKVLGGFSGEYPRVFTNRRSQVLDLFIGHGRRLCFKLYNQSIFFDLAHTGGINDNEGRDHYGITTHPLGAGGLQVEVGWTPQTKALTIRVNGTLVGHWTMRIVNTPAPVDTVIVNHKTYVGNLTPGGQMDGWRHGEIDLGGGWRWLWWLGYYVVRDNGWVWHKTHGWLWSNSQSNADVWFYHHDMGWLWTSKDHMPWVCLVNGGWRNLSAPSGRVTISGTRFVRAGQTFTPIIDVAFKLPSQPDSDIHHYIEERKRQGFNCLHFGGVEDGFFADGSSKPGWLDRLRWICGLLAQHDMMAMIGVGLIAAYDPDTWKPSVVIPNSRAKAIGKEFGQRFIDVENIFSWLVDGLDGGYDMSVLRLIADGLKEKDPTRIVSYHAKHGQQAEGDWTYAQSGHRDKTQATIRALYAARNTRKPWVDGEYRFENLDWYSGGGAITAADCEAAARLHRQLGASGYSFGNIDTAIFRSGWREQLYAPGASAVVRAVTEA